MPKTSIRQCYSCPQLSHGTIRCAALERYFQFGRPSKTKDFKSFHTKRFGRQKNACLLSNTACNRFLKRSKNQQQGSQEPIRFNYGNVPRISPTERRISEWQNKTLLNVIRKP